ncbi:YkgJ family cysteine cluster protein [Marinigracilibium pacificum]|uniref:YkgJ family cysteine cluster protein n=1 Tax=Marinigracilibium pacificum TaxID=2729599 RepID=UPI00146E600F
MRLVERVFQDLDLEISNAKGNLGYSCISSCGACCFKPDIEASVLEFLPLAYYLFKSGRAEAMYESLVENKTDICVILSTLSSENKSGFCSEYKYRGLICRLFGYSTVRKKESVKSLLVCQQIKEAYSTRIMEINGDEEVKNTLPVCSDYFYRLLAIDYKLATDKFPINTSIQKALAEVLWYFQYRSPKKSA